MTSTWFAALPVPSRSIFRKAAVWLFIATLAWAPFPLGGAISWAASVQEILIALCWILWVASTAGNSEENWPLLRTVAVPLGLALLVLVWACVQILPGVPGSWVHPVWSMAAEGLRRPVEGTISLNPWHTESEILKLASYVMAVWLAFRLARRSETAALMFNAIIVIGTAYVVYAFVLALADTGQVKVFYSVPAQFPFISGPFMLHNSFATYAGLVALAATVKLFAMGSDYVVADRGPRRLALTVIQYCFARGAPALIAVVLSLAGVVASASRAGFASTMCGLAALALGSLLMSRNNSSRLWAGAGTVAATIPLFLLIVLNGNSLADRVGQLLSSGSADEVRLALWSAAARMIGDAPWLGLGLGTFQDAYPLYSTQVFSFVMDKAHSDYLEFAAGIGLPAAIAWWSAMGWLAALCLEGVYTRRRNRLYPLTAIGASVLIAVHSTVDFSLQLPAVSLLYAAILGIGVMQSLRTRNNNTNRTTLP